MSAVGKARFLGGIPKMVNSNQQLQGIDIKHLKAMYLDQCSHIILAENVGSDVSKIATLDFPQQKSGVFFE